MFFLPPTCSAGRFHFTKRTTEGTVSNNPIKGMQTKSDSGKQTTFQENGTLGYQFMLSLTHCKHKKVNRVTREQFSFSYISYWVQWQIVGVKKVKLSNPIIFRENGETHVIMSLLTMGFPLQQLSIFAIRFPTISVSRPIIQPPL